MNLSFGTPWRCTVLCSFVHRLWRNGGVFIGRNAIERSAPSRSQKHEPNKRFHYANYEQGRFSATHFYRSNNLRSGFLYGRRKVIFPLYQSYEIRTFLAKRTPHGKLQPEASPMPWRHQICIAKSQFSYRGNLLENLAKLLPKKTKRPLPADVLRSKSPQLARVPIVASQSLLNVPFSHVLDQE